MHNLIEDPVPAPAQPVTADSCVCVCKTATTEKNTAVAAGDQATIATAVHYDIGNPEEEEDRV